MDDDALDTGGTTGGEGSAGGDKLNVLVLAGGPDREREVSLRSGAEVVSALREAGHRVEVHDINEDDLSALERCVLWPADVIFPVLHGPWGEGGGLQRHLDERDLPYVGTRAAAARRCIDKTATKATLAAAGLPTPVYQAIQNAEPIALQPPVVLKPTNEGSSIGMTICRDQAALTRARRELAQDYPSLLVERYIVGREITVGVLGGAEPTDATAQTLGPRPLPAIEIVPAAEYYDYHAKYDSDQTQYRFDIDLPASLLNELGELALATHRVLGARHLSRVDFIVDAEQRPWILEINTLPGFTSHSLLPMAARRSGLALPRLVDRLVRMALHEAMYCVRPAERQRY